MTERDTTRGEGFQPGSTYPSGGNPARDPSPGQPSGQVGQPPLPASAAAGEAGGSLKEKAAEDWQAVKTTAQEQISRAGQQAREAAGEQKDFAATRVSGIASAIERVGSELEQGDQREVGRYARQIGEGLQRFADDLKGKDLGEVAAMAEDFGRRQPGAFLGIAALAGFAASRFLTASADRRPRASAKSDGITRAGGSTATASASTFTSSSTSAPAAQATTPPTGAGYPAGYREGNHNG